MKATEQQKKLALKEFNLGDKSTFWNHAAKTISVARLSSYVGLSDYCMKDWYIRWKVDKNTTLDRLPHLDKVHTKEEVNVMKDEYFRSLAEGIRQKDHEVMEKYNVSHGIVKGWRKEYKNNGGILPEQPRRGCPRNKVIRTDKKVELPAKTVEKLPELKAETKSEESPIDILDTFFNNVSQLRDRVKTSERETEFYKEKCKKWAAQIVELQNEMARRN